jgi:hypothetical protein
MAEHAAREAQTQRIGVARAERGGAAQERGSGPGAELLMGLQRTAGNSAVARLVSAGAAIQRQLTIGGPPPVTEDWVDQPGPKKLITTEATEAEMPPDAVRQRLVAMIRANRHYAHGTEREAVLDAVWDVLKMKADVVYRMPPLTEADARIVISKVERAEPSALQGLKKQGRAFAPEGPTADREHEWGILKARPRADGTRADECVLIIGQQAEVSWGPFENCGIAIAHSHPYFESGPTRHPSGAVSPKTKEIADHQIGGEPVAGAVLWSDLHREKEDTEMMKIFPSPSDVEYAAKRGVSPHTVYTTYLVLSPDAGTTIANPNVEQGGWAQAARLRFEIWRAERVKGEEYKYKCELVAFADDVQFWNRHIVASMKTLTW